MRKPRVLITGGSGLLGVNWALEERDNATITLLMNRRHIGINGTSSISHDISSESSVKAILNRIKPDVVINTAGLTSVEFCESNPDEAHSINVDIPKYLSSECHALGISFVQISTDHIFAGDKSMLNESADVQPLNVYGKTKALAEQVVLEKNPEALVIRTNFYGWGTSYRQSFSDRIIYSLRRGKAITLFDDVFYTPILVQLLIQKVHALIDSGAFGLFNVVGNEKISKYDFGIEITNIFNLNNELIIPGKMSSSIDLVVRPQDMSLCNEKMKIILGSDLPSLSDQLQILYKQEEKGFANKLLKL